MQEVKVGVQVKFLGQHFGFPWSDTWEVGQRCEEEVLSHRGSYRREVLVKEEVRQEQVARCGKLDIRLLAFDQGNCP